MNSTITGIIVLFFWGAIILSLLSFFFLTRIIKIEHDEFPVEWEADGKPHAIPWWFPPETLKGSKPGTDPWSKGNRWLVKTPKWVIMHAKASQMLHYFRLSQYCVWLLLVGAIIIFFWFIPKQ